MCASPIPLHSTHWGLSIWCITKTLINRTLWYSFCASHALRAHSHIDTLSLPLTNTHTHAHTMQVVKADPANACSAVDNQAGKVVVFDASQSCTTKNQGDNVISAEAAVGGSDSVRRQLKSRVCCVAESHNFAKWTSGVFNAKHLCISLQA